MLLGVASQFIFDSTLNTDSGFTRLDSKRENYAVVSTSTNGVRSRTSRKFTVPFIMSFFLLASCFFAAEPVMVPEKTNGLVDSRSRHEYVKYTKQRRGGANMRSQAEVGAYRRTRTLQSADDEMVHVVVRLHSQSVSEIRASSMRKTSKSENQAIVERLKPDHNTIRSSIEKAGGVIEYQFFYAINGIKVRIPKRNLDQLQNFSNVMEVLHVNKYFVQNINSVPVTHASKVWNPTPYPNIRGEGIKIGIIDSGIDYTHANFGGPGTIAAFNLASSTSAGPADPNLFGPNAPKLKGGYDFAGDTYDGDNTPEPDPNPLDCAGHGSHVAGTAAGFGVTIDGTTLTGPYHEGIYSNSSLVIGPGVAPMADLYSYKVFGCFGSTQLVVEAIDRAIEDDMDVINLSLGTIFGTSRTAESVACDNAVKAGVVVVASAGNSGHVEYIIGSPATSNAAISVAAFDGSRPSFPSVELILDSGETIVAQNSNDAAIINGSIFTIFSLIDDPSTPEIDESFGCNLSDYPSDLPNDALVVVKRGFCSQGTKALIGQEAGAKAVLLVNYGEGYTLFFGPMDGLTIPFFGAPGPMNDPNSDEGLVYQRNGTIVTVSVSEPVIENPSFQSIASFSSGGPRNGDSFLKPDIAAPGVSIVSTNMGTGSHGISYDGTSMAAPHVAGIAALMKQSHPTWSVLAIKAALVSTANPSVIKSFDPQTAGSGFVNAMDAVNTVAYIEGDSDGNVALNFGFVEFSSLDLVQTKSIVIRNRDQQSLTFLVSISYADGVPHVLVPKKTTITVKPDSKATLQFTLSIPALTAGSKVDGFTDVSGMIMLTPKDGGNNNITISVPYYCVPRPISDISVASKNLGEADGISSFRVTVSNDKNVIIVGDADFYSWGIHSDIGDRSMVTVGIVRDVGVQSFPDYNAPDDPLIVFAISIYKRVSTMVQYLFLVYVDVDPQNSNGDDYRIVVSDEGFYTSGSYSGSMGTFIDSLSSDHMIQSLYPLAFTDSSTLLIPLPSSHLCVDGEPCLSPSSPRLHYHVESYDLVSWDGMTKGESTMIGTYNAYTPSITTGQYLSVNPGETESTTVDVNRTEWDLTPSLGALVVTLNNKAGQDQAQGIPLNMDKKKKGKKTTTTKVFKGKSRLGNYRVMNESRPKQMNP